MNTTVTTGSATAVVRSEQVPQSWDDARDGAFFRVTVLLFSAEFLYGAGVLLASYDDVA